MDTATVIFLLIVFAAFTAGTVLGFGTTILTVTFGAQLVALNVLLPIVAPLNLALGAYIAIRYYRDTRWSMLWRRILLPVGAGVPLGMWLFNLGETEWLRLAFGALVTLLSVGQLWSVKKGRDSAVTNGAVTNGAATDGAAPLGPIRRTGLLIGGGFIHGLYATGGPLIVYVVGREIHDKGEFRSTVSTMFLPLTIALIVNYGNSGLLTGSVLRLGLLSAAPMLLGMWLGEYLHVRLDNERFKLGVWVLLLAGGVILSARALLALG